MKFTHYSIILKTALAIVVLALLAACGANPVPGGAAVKRSEGKPRDMEAELQSLLDDWLSQSGVPGAVLAIDDPVYGRVIVSGGSSGKGPITNEDRFHVFSISKTFTAATILQLIDEGVLALNDPLAAFIADYPNAERVTVEQLLSHTSGYADYLDNPDFFAAVASSLDREWSWAETLQYAASMPPIDEPGRTYSYSDTNYVLLAGVIEVATGNSYVDEVRKRFLDPLGLENTFVRGYEAIPAGYIVGNSDCSYVPQEVLDILEDLYGDSGTCHDGYLPGDALPRAAMDTVGLGGDGIVSNAADLIAWARVLFQGDLLAAETLEEMLAFGVAHPNYGLGVSRTRTQAGEAVGHAGGGLDGEAKMWLAPETDTLVVAFSNQTGAIDLGVLVSDAFALVSAGKGANSQEALQQSLRSEDPAVREQAVDSLLNQPPETGVALAPTLLEMLQDDPASAVRSAAARVLGPMGNTLANQEILAALALAARDDPDAGVRSWAVKGLAFYGEEGLPYIEAALGDSSREVVEAAEEALKFAGR